jgi:hypothetical protein
MLLAAMCSPAPCLTRATRAPRERPPPQVSPGLVVAGGRATFNGTPLMTPRGYVTLPPAITDGSEIH